MICKHCGKKIRLVDLNRCSTYEFRKYELAVVVGLLPPLMKEIWLNGDSYIGVEGICEQPRTGATLAPIWNLHEPRDLSLEEVIAGLQGIVTDLS